MLGILIIFLAIVIAFLWISSEIKQHKKWIEQVPLWKKTSTSQKDYIFVGDSSTEEDEEYLCPNCGQPCSKEEYESGYCLDCDGIEMGFG